MEPCLHRMLVRQGLVLSVLFTCLRCTFARENRECGTTKYRFNENALMGPEDVINGEEPMEFRSQCPRTQQCLLFQDDELANILASSIGTALPVFGNEFIEDIDPSVSEILRNSELVTDANSVMFIEAYGVYRGPVSIASYRALPKAVGVQAWINTTIFQFEPSYSKLELLADVTELFPNMASPGSSLWKKEYLFYPCSGIQKLEVLQLPEESRDRFRDLIAEPNSTTEMCGVIMEHCIGEHQQFDNVTDCITYMDALPLVDPICQQKHQSDTAAKGESRMCKYLHHGMIPFQPELHCYHSGGKGLFDAAGYRKCTPVDCIDDSTPQNLIDAIATYNYSRFVNESSPNSDSTTIPSCEDEERNEIVAATILTLRYCLPSLSLGKCTANCSQAVTTYLGRYAENGALCRCNEPVHSSALLHHLDIDANALLQLCDDRLTSFRKPTCLSQHEDYMHSCGGTETYVSSRGCKKFDFGTIESLFRYEWSINARLEGRRTTSDLIASAECDVFLDWYSNAKNVKRQHALAHLSGLLHGAWHSISDPGASSEGSLFISDLYIHPSLGKANLRHAELLIELESNQERSVNSIHRDECWYEMEGNAFEPVISPYWQGTISTDNATHDAAIVLVNRTLRGLIHHSNSRDYSIFLKPEAANENYQEMDRLAVGLRMGTAIIRALFTNESSMQNDRLETISEFDSKIESFFAVVSSTFHPKALHRLFGGNLLAIALLSNRYQIKRLLKELVPPAEMQGYAEEFNYTQSMDVGKAYEFLGTLLVDISGVLLAGMSLTDRMRKDYCALKDEWENRPVSFILEHLRLDPPGRVSTIGSKEGSTLHATSVAAANVDPDVFSEPLSFRPRRSELRNTMIFNQIEADYRDGTNRTTKRACPARGLSVKFLQDVAPAFFPSKTSCYGDVRLMNDIHFTSQLISVDDAGKTQYLEVYKANEYAGNGFYDNGKENLIIMLHDFPLSPQYFSKLMSEIIGTMDAFDTRTSFWAPMLPGWGRGSQLGDCSFAKAAKLITQLVHKGKQENRHVYLFGQGHIGGSIAWYAAEQLQENLEGLITSAPHPWVTTTAKSSLPVSTLSFYDLLLPTTELYLPLDDFSRLRESLNNETWWDVNWKYELLKQWETTGSRRLLCYHRENYKSDPLFAPVDGYTMRYLDPNTNILLLSSQLDTNYPKEHYQKTLNMLGEKRGKSIKWHQIKGAGCLETLQEDEYVGVVALKIRDFMRRVRQRRYSVWSTFNAVPDFSEESLEDGRDDSRFYVACVLSIVIFISGIALELGIGPLMLVSGSKFNLWRLAQILTAPISIACFASQSFTSIPLWILSVFKFGFPQITTSLISPIKEPDAVGGKLERVMMFLDGIWMALHHYAGTAIYAMVLFHLEEMLPIAIAAMPLVLQHMGMVLQEYYIISAAILIFGLEIWFQLEAYALLTSLRYTFSQIALIWILAGHYFWFIQTIILIGKQFFCPEPKKLNPYKSRHYRKHPVLRRTSLMAEKAQVSMLTLMKLATHGAKNEGHNTHGSTHNLFLYSKRSHVESSRPRIENRSVNEREAKGSADARDGRYRRGLSRSVGRSVQYGYDTSLNGSPARQRDNSDRGFATSASPPRSRGSERNLTSRHSGELKCRSDHKSRGHTNSMEDVRTSSAPSKGQQKMILSVNNPDHEDSSLDIEKNTETKGTPFTSPTSSVPFRSPTSVDTIVEHLNTPEQSRRVRKHHPTNLNSNLKVVR